MTDFIQTLLDGIAIGTIYGALSVALVLIYRTTGIINFAQGEMGMFATFIVWAIYNLGVPLPLAALLGIGIAFAGGMLVERVVMRAVEQYDELLTVLTTLGLYLIFNGLAGYIWGPTLREIPSLLGNGAVHAFGLTIGNASIMMLCTMSVAIALLFLLLQRTRLGLAMRAAAAGPVSARLSGVRVESMYMVGWGLASAIACLAGVLIAPRLFLDSSLMSGVIIYAFAAGVLAGFDSLPAAAVGGVIVGVVETLSSTYVSAIGTDLKILVPLALIMAVLLVKPTGIFARGPARSV